MTDALTAAVVGAIVGGVVGGGIGLIGVFYAAARSEQSLRRLADEQNQTLLARALENLKVEVDYNTMMLDSLRKRVSLNLDGLPEEQELQKRMRFADDRLPDWLHNTWDSQRLHVAGALSRDHIGDMAVWFAQLKRLADLQHALLQTITDRLRLSYRNYLRDPSPYRQYRIDRNQIPQSQAIQLGLTTLQWDIERFNEDTLPLWNSISSTLENLFRTGAQLSLAINPESFRPHSRPSLVERIKTWFGRLFRRNAPITPTLQPRNSAES